MGSSNMATGRRNAAILRRRHNRGPKGLPILLRDESVEAGDESVETGDESIEGGEKTQQPCYNA